MFQKRLAECAERFTALNLPQRSSGFQHSLADLIIEELETRIKLYIEHENEITPPSFEEFFTKEKHNLLAGVTSRFGKKISAEDRCELLCKKYKALLFRSSVNPKPPIGFNCSRNEVANDG